MLDTAMAELRRILNPAAGDERSLTVRTMWYFTEKLVLKSHLNPFSIVREMALKAFGSEIGRGVVIKPGVRVKFPWKLRLMDGAALGEDVWIDNIERVEVGESAIVSQGTYLCTGNHDWYSRAMPLTARPITIEERAWVGARCTIGPGVTVGRNAVVKLGSVVTKDVPPLDDKERWSD